MKKWFSSFFKFNLKQRLYAAFGLILIVPTIAVGFLAYHSAKDRLEEEFLNSAKENVGLLNSNITNTIEPKFHDANSLSEQVKKTDYQNGENSEVIKKLKQYIDLHPEVQTIYVGTVDGRMITYPKMELPADFDPRERPWYQEAEQKKGNVVITSPYIDAGNGEMVVTITKTINDGSGVIGIDLNISKLTETTEEVNIGKEGYAFLLDTKKNYIVHPNEKTGTVAEEGFYDNLYNDSAGHLNYKLDGKSKVMFFSSNDLTGWKVAGTMYTEEINDSAKSILQTTLIVIAIAIVIGAAIVYFIIHSITGG
ncbi:cache domain-containing protein [Bacillus sp. SA1-12]|uniref:cache domain-containing protein n=1 Tax=Bacillus sp. SA1-12 TaxID=1455638 RepID=UPI000A508CC5